MINYFNQYSTTSKKKRAFISFDFDNDEQLKNLLSGQAKLNDSPFFFDDWSVKEPFPQSTWKSDARTKIKQCDFMIVLIGLNTYECSGVLEEIKMADEEYLPTFGIFEQGKKYYVPAGLEKRFIAWTWDNITWAINNLNSYLPSTNG